MNQSKKQIRQADRKKCWIEIWKQETMEAKFSPKVKEVISYSREEALRLNHDYIGIEHLLLGLIREGEEPLRGYKKLLPLL